MAITLVGVTSGWTDGSGDLTVAPHASAEAGDVLVLTVMHQQNQSAPAPSSPEWELIVADRHPVNAWSSEWNASYWCAYDDFVSSAVPAGSYHAHRVVTIAVWRGVDNADPVDAVSTMYTTDGQVSTIPSITTTVDGAMVIQALAYGESGSWLSSVVNANLTDLAEVDWTYGAPSFGGDLLICAGTKDSAGATGSTVVTIPHNVRTVSLQFALAPGVYSPGGAGGGLMLMGVG